MFRPRNLILMRTNESSLSRRKMSGGLFYQFDAFHVSIGKPAARAHIVLEQTMFGALVRHERLCTVFEFMDLNPAGRAIVPRADGDRFCIEGSAASRRELLAWLPVAIGTE